MDISLLGNCEVSIPERVWGGLEPRAAIEASTTEAFQSLRGFGVGWSAPPLYRPTFGHCFNP